MKNSNENTMTRVEKFDTSIEVEFLDLHIRRIKNFIEGGGVKSNLPSRLENRQNVAKLLDELSQLISSENYLYDNAGDDTNKKSKEAHSKGLMYAKLEMTKIIANY